MSDAGRGRDGRWRPAGRNRVFWKVCGITRSEDAGLAVELGADAIGFVFHPPSPRAVDVATAAAVAADVGEAVLKVGVFVNVDDDELRRVAGAVGLDVLQLHGDEAPERCAGQPLPVWKAVRTDTADLERYGTVARLLLDAGGGGRRGGTGETVDWSVAGTLAATHDLVLAGGLRPENVARAVEEVRPWGVDVASGVEAAPGRKDPDRLRRFAAALEPYR